MEYGSVVSGYAKLFSVHFGAVFQHVFWFLVWLHVLKLFSSGFPITFVSMLMCFGHFSMIKESTKCFYA